MPKKHLRFNPDNDEVAFISFDTKEFKKELSALIVNESHHGACFVVNRLLIPENNPIVIGQILLAKIGHIDPLKAKVCWLKEVETNLLKIGIELLE